LSKRVIIVGGGMSGMVAALYCQRAGFDTHLIEASDRLGGRLATDHIDGVICDRGFQVLLTGYPMVKHVLSFNELQLRYFSIGAQLWTGSGFEVLRHPLCHFQSLISTLLGRHISWSDQYRLLKWIIRTRFSDPKYWLHELHEQSSSQFLSSHGFSQSLLDTLLRPFFRGVLLDPELNSSARLLTYYFYYFLSGQVAIPAHGISAIPNQLSHCLTSVHIMTNAPVTHMNANSVAINHETHIEADHVICCTDTGPAHRLLNLPEPDCHHVQTVYINSIKRPPVSHLLTLNGSGRGIITHLHCASDFNPVPANRDHILCVTVVRSVPLPTDELTQQVISELCEWFNASPHHFDIIHHITIANALPKQPVLSPPHSFSNDGIVLGGDWTQTGSLQGAMDSGRQAAEYIITP
jgi:hypothetical protein